MNLRIALTVSALPPNLGAALIPTNAIPIWVRIGLVVLGISLLILSFVPKQDETGD